MQKLKLFPKKASQIGNLNEKFSLIFITKVTFVELPVPLHAGLRIRNLRSVLPFFWSAILLIRRFADLPLVISNCQLPTSKRLCKSNPTFWTTQQLPKNWGFCLQEFWNLWKFFKKLLFKSTDLKDFDFQWNYTQTSCSKPMGFSLISLFRAFRDFRRLWDSCDLLFCFLLVSRSEGWNLNWNLNQNSLDPVESAVSISGRHLAQFLLESQEVGRLRAHIEIHVELHKVT